MLAASAAGALEVSTTFIGADIGRPARLGNSVIGTLCAPPLTCEPWISDGTFAGTQALRPAGDAIHPRNTYVTAGNRVYFYAIQGLDNSRQVFSTDGSSAGTLQVQTPVVPAPVVPMVLRKPAAAGSSFIFISQDGGLWRTDSTAAGTFKLIDIDPALTNQDLESAGVLAYFVNSDAAHGVELWRTDGSVAGTFRIADTAPGALSGAASGLTGVADRLYFRASDGSGVASLHVTDGTAAGTSGPLLPLSSSWFARSTGSSAVVLTAGAGGLEIWRTDGTSAGTAFGGTVALLVEPDQHSVAALGSHAYFSAISDLDGSKGLWRTDGTLAGTELVTPTVGTVAARELTVAGDVLYCLDSGGLWRTQGTPATTFRIVTGTAYPYAAVGATLLFANTAAWQLWRTDGTVAGSSQVFGYDGAEAAIAFVASDYPVGEGDRSVTLQVRRLGPTASPASVRWAATHGTATAGLDYGRGAALPQGTLSWAANDTTPKAIVIPVLQDSLAEGPESFSVALSTPSAGILLVSPSTATVTINDDEVPPESRFNFSQPKYVVMENAGSVALTVQREAISGGFTAPATVSYATQPASALATSDYSSRSGTLTWTSAETGDKTIVIPIVNNAVAEPHESFTVTLGTSGAGSVIGTPATTVTILDDDEVFPRFGAVPEGWTVPAGATEGWHASSDPGAYEGAFSLRSDQIDDGESAQVELTRAFAAGNITFRVKISSEAGFDKLRFLVDDLERGSWSGTTNTAWQIFSMPVAAGLHTLRWSYEKDASASMGYDAAWIDGVSLP